MTLRSWSPQELRDLHLNLAVGFEAEAFTADDGFEIEYLLEKSLEAFDGALHFEQLYIEGVTVVTRAQP